MPYQGGGGGRFGGGGGGGGGGRGGRGGGRGGGRYGDEGEADHDSEQFRKLFVGGLSYETDEDGLRSHFEQWGEIVDCVVMRDPNTKRSRGFGFVTYKESSMIDEAQNNRPHKLDNREVETKRAMPRDSAGASQHQSVKKMFIGGLKDDTTEEHIRDCFSQYGKIDTIDIVVDKATGKVRGFAFVTFKDYDSVDRAVLMKRHDLNTRKVEVKKAISKDNIEGGGRGGGGGRGRGRSDSYGSSSYGGAGGYGGSSAGGFGGGGYGGGYGVSQGGWGGSGGGDYGNSWGGGGFGSNYGGDYGGGPMKASGYSSRGQGPYGGGGSYAQGGGGGYSSGGGYRR